ncbi:MAG TPA: serine/threonine-protein kinase [Rudaea sp.]
MSDDVRIPGYRVQRTLGVGGMATVYLAEQQSLEREVALKVMAPALAASTDFCQQFLKEGRITAKLSHPNLVTVYDIGSHDGTYYMASEYLPAGSLRERLDAGLSVTDALEIARDIASGLSYAHEMGFVHRDVKPGNILFRTNGSAVLADFGIAKAIKSVSTMTMAGNAIGTPDYMSPEQAQANLVDGRTDLYSLGAVLFEMLTGSKPYIAKDPYAVALRHVTDPVPSLPDALAWLQPLIDMMMAKDRDRRCPTGEVFIAACDELLGGHPEYTLRQKSVTPPPQPPESRPQANKSRLVALASLARIRRFAPFALLVPVVAVVLVWRTRAPDIPAVPVATETPGRSPVLPANLPPAPPIQAEPAVPTTPTGLERIDTATLLARASGYLDLGFASGDGRRFAFPDGDNAIDLFREVLRRDPANPVAAQGLARLVAFYQTNAQSMLARGLDSTSADLVEKGLRAQPDNAALLKLKADLAAKAAAQGNN